MMDWLMAGGWAMGFLMIIGGFTLLAAATFARRPDPTQLERIHSLARAMAWATLAGVASDLAAVGTKIPRNLAWAHSPDLHLLVLEGIAESLTPAIFGGSALAVVALLLAAGHARLRAVGVSP